MKIQSTFAATIIASVIAGALVTVISRRFLKLKTEENTGVLT